MYMLYLRIRDLFVALCSIIKYSIYSRGKGTNAISYAFVFNSNNHG